MKKAKHPDAGGAVILNKRLAGIIIFLFAFLLYANTIPNEYSLDDQFVVKDQGMVLKGFAGIPEILTTPYMVVAEGKNTPEYRPMAKISFAIERQFTGDHPPISHAIQAMLYGLLCLVFFTALLQWLPEGGILPAMTAALLFAAHPIHTEVAASLKNREEIFSLLFSLLFLMMLLKAWGKKNLLLWTGAALMLLLATMSKMSSIVVVLWAPLVLYYRRRAKLPAALLTGAVLLLLSAVYYGFVFRYVLHATDKEAARVLTFVENPLSGQHDVLLQLGIMFNSMKFYLIKLIYPHPLNWYYGYNMIPLQPPWAWQPLLFFLIHLFLFGWAVWKIPQRHPLAFAVLLYLLALSPYLNFPVLMPGIVAERVALFASAGFCLAVAWLLMKAAGMKLSETKVKPVFLLLVLPLLLLYSAKTFSRNRDWKNYLTLFSADMPHLSHSYIANYNYGVELYRAYLMGPQPPPEGLLAQVLKYFHHAIDVYPDAANPYYRIGYILSAEQKKFEEALPYFQKAVTLQPDDAEFHLYLAACYRQLKQNNAAITEYKTADRLNVKDTIALINVAVIFSGIGKPDSAVYYNRLALKKNAASEIAIANMGFFFKKIGEMDSARYYFNKALSIHPNRKDVQEALEEMGTEKK